MKVKDKMAVMNSAAVKFFRKEIIEFIRLKKIFILPAIFLFFGLLSPLTARFMGEIFKAVGGGVEINLPPQTWKDSYGQLFKNLNQLGLIVLILSLMGMVADEKIKGSLILVLTKSLGRAQFILCKFAAAIVFFTFSLILSSAVCAYYTMLLFPEFYSSGLLIGIGIFWIYGVLYIAIMLLSSTVAKSNGISAVLGFLSFAFLSAAGFIPKIGAYSPGMLGSLSTGILYGTNTLSDAVYPVIVSLALILLCTGLSVSIFRKQEL